MFVAWAFILLMMYFLASEAIQPRPNLAFLTLIGVLTFALYFLRSTRCPRCHREFFAEKSGVGVLFGRFACVACGFDPTASRSDGESP